MPAKKTPKKKTTASKAKIEANKAQALARMSMLELLEAAVDDEGTPLNDKVVKVLIDAMEADKVFQISEGSGQERSCHLEYEPDHAIRIRAAELYLNRTMGLPVRREEHIHRNVTTNEDVQELLNTSPEFRETMQNMLDKANTVAES